MTRLPVTFAVAALAAGLTAQIPTPTDCGTSWLRRTAGPFETNAITGNQLDLGVQWLQGLYYVSTTADTVNGPWEIVVFDGSGALVSRFPQLGQPSAFGLRDGASDGTNLFFGNENGLFGFDPSGVAVGSVEAANGPQAVTFPITGPGLAALGIYRANAFNPNGNGGDGSFFTGDFGSDILEIDLAGNILRTFSNQGQWSAYGLAYDINNDVLWVNDDGTGNLIAIDASTGMLNGDSVIADLNEPGGLSFGALNALVTLEQRDTGSDVVTDFPFDQFENPPVDILTGVDGNLDTAISLINDRTGTWGWDVDLPPGTAVQYFLNTSPQSTFCADTSLLLSPPNTPFESQTILAGLLNFEMLTFISTPSSIINVERPGLAGTPVVVPTPVALASTLPAGLMRIQGLYADFAAPQIPIPSIPIRSTNPGYLFFDKNPTLGVTVSASGTNSFNSDPSQGYWSITNDSADPMKAVVELTIDLSTVSGGSLRFDTDQNTAAGIFVQGNAAGVGALTCAGTYRNGSDLTVGLDYNAPQINLFDPTCTVAPGQNSGAEGTLPTAIPGDFQALTWRFAGGLFLNGATFEFDIDTDGLPGPGGQDNAGATVTVRYADGTTDTGVLSATGPSTSSLTF